MIPTLVLAVCQVFRPWGETQYKYLYDTYKCKEFLQVCGYLAILCIFIKNKFPPI